VSGTPAPKTVVLAVIHSATFGGPHNEILRLTPALRTAGFDPIVLLPAEAGSAAARLASGGVRTVSLPMVRWRKRRWPGFWLLFPIRFVRDVARLIRLIRQSDVGLVHGYGINLQAAVAARLAGVPLVWSVIDIGAPRPLRALVANALVRLADGVLLDGASIADAYPVLARLGSRARVYYPPVPLDTFRRPSPPRTRTGATVTVGTVANLNPDKGLEDLIESAQLVVARADVRFELTGARHATQAALADRLEHAAAGVPEGRFRILGETDDVPGRLAGLDIFVVSSRHEGTTTTAIEGMAAGLPVVATRVGGLAEIVEDGVTGLLVPPGDPPALAAAILELVGDAGRRRLLGKNGRAAAEARFGVERTATVVLDAYRAALNRKSGQGRLR
jgi:glycosyltransferase involved in cell wall biosynthesis